MSEKSFLGLALVAIPYATDYAYKSTGDIPIYLFMSIYLLPNLFMLMAIAWGNLEKIGKLIKPLGKSAFGITMITFGFALLFGLQTWQGLDFRYVVTLGGITTFVVQVILFKKVRT